MHKIDRASDNACCDAAERSYYFDRILASLIFRWNAQKHGATKNSQWITAFLCQKYRRIDVWCDVSPDIAAKHSSHSHVFLSYIHSLTHSFAFACKNSEIPICCIWHWIPNQLSHTFQPILDKIVAHHAFFERNCTTFLQYFEPHRRRSSYITHHHPPSTSSSVSANQLYLCRRLRMDTLKEKTSRFNFASLNRLYTTYKPCIL